MERWRDRTRYAYERFPFKPPAYPPHSPKWPKDVQPPYEGAKPWECSIYFYWWAYLRENEEYKAFCAQKVKTPDHPYWKTWRQLNDVREDDFHGWWFENFQLFTDAGGRQTFPDEAEPGPDWKPETLTVSVPISYDLKLMETDAIQMLREQYQSLPRERFSGIIEYRPIRNIALPTLHRRLHVWKLKKADPDLDDAEIADQVGIDVLPIDGTLREIEEARERGEPVGYLETLMRRKKRLAVQREYRIAAQYVENAGRGEFPKWEKR